MTEQYDVHLLHLVVLGEVTAVVRQCKVGRRRRAPQPHLCKGGFRVRHA